MQAGIADHVWSIASKESLFVSDEPIDTSEILPNDVPFAEIRKRAAPDMGPLGSDPEAKNNPAQHGELQLALFEGITVRKIFHEDHWRFAVVDIIAALTGSEKPSRYWSELKAQLIKNEGFSELFGKIEQLKLKAADNKFYLTETVTVETALRIIQSIPSRKAEPFKRWLAQVGCERIQEIQDPEIAVKRAILMWQAQGRTSDWCNGAESQLTDASSVITQAG